MKLLWTAPPIWSRASCELAVALPRGQTARRAGQTRPMSESGVAERLEAVRGRIARAAERAGRDAASVRLIAVTKTVSVERITEAVAAGITEVGENRVQEAQRKHGQLPTGLRWHLVGHLQRNKAAVASQLFDTVQSVDSERIAALLARHRAGRDGPLEVLVEVELTGLPTRTGIPPESIEATVRAAASLPGLRLAGLMTIAPFGDPEAARGCFRRLRELRDGLRSRLHLDLDDLSMGMSDDFEVAVEEGATTVRIGRALFGERPPRTG